MAQGYIKITAPGERINLTGRVVPVEEFHTHGAVFYLDGHKYIINEKDYKVLVHMAKENPDGR